jgi:hypothetical protein
MNGGFNQAFISYVNAGFSIAMFDYRKVFGGMKIHNPSYFDLTRRVPTFRPTPLAGAKALFHRQVQANVSWTAWRHPREY